VRHLKEHRFDGRSYRAKYGIPRTQPLAAKEVIETEGDRAEFKTMGEGSDLCKGTGEGTTSCSTKEADCEEEKQGNKKRVRRGQVSYVGFVY
jgi:ROS/MUCR transcriptional regulator protein